MHSLGFLALQLIEANSLYNLKLIYRATTLWTNEISVFKHRDINFSLEQAIRKGILDRLNNCIANYENF